MLEVKPLTTADHFVHATHPIAVTRALTPHAATTSVLVTISPQAAALAASRQKETAKTMRSKLRYAYYDEETEIYNSDKKHPVSETDVPDDKDGA
jgi:hypothetical protein